MTGVIAHDQAERLRSAIDQALGAASDVPHSARAALFRVLEVLEANGDAVVLPSDAFVSTQQAADILGISRMAVVRLIDRGELAAEGGGIHRRIAVTALEYYRTRSTARRRAALRDLAQDAAEDRVTDRVISTR